MGARAVVEGLLLEVRPLPMAAALLCALLGMAWPQGSLANLPAQAPALLAAVFFGLYTAHLMDTYVDVEKRGDRTPSDYPLLFRDSTDKIAGRHYPVLMAASTALTLLFAAGPIAERGLLVAAPIVLGLGIALSYAPKLDRTTAGVTFGYPVGVTSAAAAGYALAAGLLDARFALLAAALLLALAGTKVRSDIIDVQEDAPIAKRTVPVVLGPPAALAAGYGLALAGLGLAALLPVFVQVTPWFALPPAAAAVAVAFSYKLDPFRGSMVMAGSLLVLLLAEVLVLALLA